MALQKCKECGGQVSKKADTCPHCGAKRGSQGIGCGTTILVILVTLGVLGWVADEMVDGPMPASPTRVSTPPEPAAPPEPVLVLESMTCTRSEGGRYAMIEGRAKNVSRVSLDAVLVVGAFSTADNQPLGSESTYLDIRPLLPNQSSGFTIYGPTNPEYGRCAVEAFMVGGRQVRWKRG